MPDGAYTLGAAAALRRARRRDGADQVPLDGRRCRSPSSPAPKASCTSTAGGRTWVSQSHGVHPYRVGETARASTSTSATASTSPPDGAQGRLMARHRASRNAAPQLHRRTRRGPERLGAEAASTSMGTTAAPMRCSARRAAARPRCSTSSPACCSPTEGRVLFDDRDVTRLAPTERNIAQVFQFPVIYDTMTVYDNLAFPLRNRGVARGRGRRPRARHRRPARADGRCSASAPPA